MARIRIRRPGETSLATMSPNPSLEEAENRMKSRSSIEPVTLKYWYALMVTSATNIVAAWKRKTTKGRYGLPLATANRTIQSNAYPRLKSRSDLISLTLSASPRSLGHETMRKPFNASSYKAKGTRRLSRYTNSQRFSNERETPRTLALAFCGSTTRG